ncbi:LSM1 protein [Pelomyxa schiedti]|nr:LSM1 protein [Pelomyxa schiedti]
MVMAMAATTAANTTTGPHSPAPILLGVGGGAHSHSPAPLPLVPPAQQQVIRQYHFHSPSPQMPPTAVSPPRLYSAAVSPAPVPMNVISTTGSLTTVPVSHIKGSASQTPQQTPANSTRPILLYHPTQATGSVRYYEQQGAFLDTSWSASASLVEDLDQKVMVMIRDAKDNTKNVFGILRSFDQYGNIVLESAYERIYVGGKYGEKKVGLYLVRGENIVLMGTVNKANEQKAHSAMQKVPFEELIGPLQAHHRAEEQIIKARDGCSSLMGFDND